MGNFSSVDTSDKKIVIVGGGYGGSYLAYKLISNNVGTTTLIEPRDYTFHSIGALRAAVDESYGNKLFIPFEGKMADAHIKAKATGLDPTNNQITLDNGETLTYTDLVIATGSNCPFPAKLPSDTSNSKQDVLKQYKEIHMEIEKSNRFVIVGGGAVGIEIAGEIITEFPDKQVTVVNSRNYLVTNRAKPSYQEAVVSALKQRNIELLSSERVENLNELQLNKNVDQVVKLRNGKELSCDMVISCIGTKVNNEFYKQDLAHCVNEMGALKVNEFFQVKGHENIFAIGDVTAIDEEKMAYTATQHVEYLFQTLKGNPTKYLGSEFALILPIGRNGGVMQYKGFVLGDFMVRKIKSQDLFAGKMWGNLGLKPPSSAL